MARKGAALQCRKLLYPDLNTVIAGAPKSGFVAAHRKQAAIADRGNTHIAKVGAPGGGDQGVTHILGQILRGAQLRIYPVGIVGKPENQQLPAGKRAIADHRGKAADIGHCPRVELAAFIIAEREGKALGVKQHRGEVLQL